MKIVLTHVYNESYLLKWWIPHHQKRFDHGIIIDYNSTDDTRELVKELAPNWEFIDSQYKMFGAVDNTNEMTFYEKLVQEKYPGAWMISLTATEFFVGDTSKLIPSSPQDLYVACDIMVAKPEEMFVEPDSSISLIYQRSHGIPLEFNENTRNNWAASKFDRACAAAGLNSVMSQRLMRALHNFEYDYLQRLGPGRHAWSEPSPDFRIFWYGFSPITEGSIKRKLAVQNKIPQTDVQVGFGVGSLVNRDSYMQRVKFNQEFGLVDLNETVVRLEGDKYRN